MSQRLVALGAAVVAVFSTGVGAAVAANTFDGTDGHGNINACFTNSSGALRVINTAGGQRCRNTETALSWKQAASAGGGSLQLAAMDSTSPVNEPAALVEPPNPAEGGQVGAPIVVSQSSFTMPQSGFAVIYFVQSATDDGNVSCDGATQGISTAAGLLVDGGTPGEVGTVSYTGGAVQGPYFYPEHLWLTAGSHTVSMNEFPAACAQTASGNIALQYHAHLYYVP